MARLTSPIFCHVQERRPHLSRMCISHLFWLSKSCHGPSNRCRPSRAPGRSTGPTEHRGSSLPLTFFLTQSSQSWLTGPARSTSRLCILSHLFRSTPNCTVLIPNVPHAGHSPISPPRTLTQVPDHPHTPHNLPSPTLPASPPSFALFPPRFDHTLS